jgi:preprotein translocase SecE subunit
LATKDNKSPSNTAETANVTRIKASSAAKPSKTATKKKEIVAPEPAATRPNPLKATGGYFAGAWHELRQVRWPDRRATWGMVVALLGFTAFFAIVVLVLDALFKYLFDVMLG